VPTLYVWSDNDIALTEKPARATEKYVSADYRFEVLRGVSHWIPDEEPEVAANLLLEWFEAHPA
jgi:pimeloyl-ACP methyl ester carboxylesterase